jgi:uncharacterized protein YdeI (YjbR/CyaY-like superfamily)
MPANPKPRFFRTPAEFRRWLERHHASQAQLWIGFYKKDSGKSGMTYVEAVDEALCFGWIDGLVRGHDAVAYVQRFTPRKAKSTWSAVNLRKVEALKSAGRMAPAGLEAHAKRDPTRAGLYSFENRHVVLSPALVKRFRSKKAAWKFFEAQPPGYRRLAAFWVMSAKKEETRERRFARLLGDSQEGQRVASVAGSTPAEQKHLPARGRRKGS